MMMVRILDIVGGIGACSRSSRMRVLSAATSTTSSTTTRRTRKRATTLRARRRCYGSVPTVVLLGIATAAAIALRTSTMDTNGVALIAAVDAFGIATGTALRRCHRFYRRHDHDRDCHDRTTIAAAAAAAAAHRHGKRDGRRSPPRHPRDGRQRYDCT